MAMLCKGETETQQSSMVSTDLDLAAVVAVEEVERKTGQRVVVLQEWGGGGRRTKYMFHGNAW